MRTHASQGCRPRLALSALVVLAWGAGCTRPNPAYLGPYDGAADDVAATGDAAADTAIDRKPDATANRAPDTGSTDTKTDVKADTKMDVGDGGDGGSFVCVTADQCTARSAPVCGTWVCRAGACVLNCPNCIDADGDGYGVGSGCAGLDCDDTDPTIQGTHDVRNCSAGAVTGTCHTGSQSCTAGVWSTCSGQVVPSGEACNGQDDDCNGMSDDNFPVSTFTCGQGLCKNTVQVCSTGVLEPCMAFPSTSGDDTTCDEKDDDCDGLVDQNCATRITDCIHVSPNGDDGGDGSTGFPLRTIPAGIAGALLSTATSPKAVCVAGGATCQDRATYTVGDGSSPPLSLFQMADGVSLYGSYESTTWTRCPLAASAPDPTATIELREAGGVRFPPSISQPTALDGFVLTRNISGGTANMIAAVTIDGAKQVRLSNLVVTDAPSAMHTYGVYMFGGGAGGHHPLPALRRRRHHRCLRRVVARLHADDP